MSRRVSMLLILLVGLFSVSSVLAQGGGRGGGRPTPGGGEGGGGLLQTRTAEQGSGGQQGAVQATVQAAATLQAGSIAATLQPILSRTPVPMDGSRFENLRATLMAQLPESDVDAASAITNFASLHLGLALTPLYAGNLDTGAAAYPEAFQEILSQLPADVQALLETAASSGAATYWGVFNNGAAMVAAGDCNAEQCTITQENLVFQIATASGGLYGLYIPGAPATSDEALALIEATYPALTAYTFQPVATQSGYAFQSVTTDISAQAASTLKAVVTGVVSANGQSLVYVFVGVGEGYVSFVR